LALKPKADLMAALRSRRQREGLVRLELWVPAKLVKQVRDYVKRMTADSGDGSKK
jgi:vacuolar-type H+-ATPase subunit I/STV1